MLRAVIQTIVELTLTLVLAFIGLVTLVGTLDEYRSGKAFNKAMDSYSAGAKDEVLDHLRKATTAKADYAAPQELLGKLYIDQADEDADPRKYADARKLFAELRKEQEAADGRAALPVLIGLAIAELEATRARNPGEEELRLAVTEARIALDKALDVYPDSGDLHVNLATIALLANNAPLAKRHLAKVRQTGNISVDALPFLYNLSGLAALEEGDFPKAVAEFEKTEEFKQGWTVPRFNLAAAYAQSLFRGGLDDRTAEHYARSIAELAGQLKRDKHPMLPLVCHALAVHWIRKGKYDTALRELREAEKFGELTWHGRFNRAVAQYLVAVEPRMSEKRREALIDEARPVFARALRSKRATPRDLFVAAAALGKICSLEGKPAAAIDYFEQAIAVKPKGKDAFIPAALPQIYRSLAAACYEAGQYRKAHDYLEKSRELPDKGKVAAILLDRLSTKPTVTDFSVKLGKIATDYDVRIAATVAAKAAPEPLTAKNIRLTLTNTTDKTTRPIPFELLGARVHALLINVGQGAHRIECQVTDSVGNVSDLAVKTLRIDREPPRVLQRSPTPGKTIGQLTTVDFTVFDALGSVDFESLLVTLKYPPKSKHASRFLISRGKYVYDAADGSIKKGSAARDQVRAPVPPDATPGLYTVLVRVRDLEGRLTDAEWSFTLR